MTETYNFTFYDGHEIFVTVPIINNFVQRDEFMPDFIKQFPFIGSCIALQPINEFKTDCQHLVNIINANKWQYDRLESYGLALRVIVKKHISNYNRLFFYDLTSYIDDCCHLMQGVGFNVHTFKNRIYLHMIFLTIVEFKDYIKDGNPMTGIVPFTQTNMFQLVSQNIDKYLFIESILRGNNNPHKGKIIYESSDHIRFQNGENVSGHNYGCIRRLVIEKSIDAKEGYTISMYNMDGQSPQLQMTPKPMKIVNVNGTIVEFRGFGYDENALAMNIPLEEAAFENYGLIITIEDDKVIHAQLNLYDRDVNIVYLK